MPADPLLLIAHGLTGSPWPLVLVYFLCATQLTILAVTLYLHRSQAHRGVDFHPLVAHVFRFWAWLTTAMVTREWVAIHRKHHAKCETPEDPHSPQVYGIRTVLFHGVVLYQRARKDRALVEQYGSGTPDDWIERHVYARLPVAGPILMLLINLALFGMVGLAIWAIQMLWIPILAAGVVNGLGHWWGYRNFETSDTSTNLTPWAFFIGGEELHNNHHAYPSSARFALRQYEFDIGWVVIRLLSALRLARVTRVAPSLAVRPNVTMPDMDTVKALLTHRFSVLREYFHGVIKPVLRAEIRSAGDRVDRLRGRLRRALANDGRWLDAESRERMSAWVRERPLLATVMDYRRRLAETLDRAGRNGEALREAICHWCEDAERSGVDALAEFARRLRGYQLQER
ncbi:MAG: fatty acid desaturase [Lysobacterales bacterium]